jgi:hypothetical protein
MGALLMIAPCHTSAANRAQLKPVQLKVEKRNTVHLGQIVTLRLPSARPYLVEATGSALVAIRPAHRRSTRLYQYRAARPGDETILVVPANLPPRHCISCVTIHYFVTVLR